MSGEETPGPFRLQNSSLITIIVIFRKWSDMNAYNRTKHVVIIVSSFLNVYRLFYFQILRIQATFEKSNQGNLDRYLKRGSFFTSSFSHLLRWFDQLVITWAQVTFDDDVMLASRPKNGGRMLETNTLLASWKSADWTSTLRTCVLLLCGWKTRKFVKYWL